MSKYSYPSWHEMKDLVAIYREDVWDPARIVVWDPVGREHYKLTFCGSTQPGLLCEEGTINFVLYPERITRWYTFKSNCVVFYIKLKYRLQKFAGKIKSFWKKK